MDTEYDYIGTILVADSDTSNEESAGGSTKLSIEGGAENGLNSLRVLKFDQALNEGATGRFGNSWMAVGAMIMLLGW